jgi:hypothetical protein
MSEDIRYRRSRRAHEIEWERDHMERRDRRYLTDGRPGSGYGGFDDERVTEREVIYSNTVGGKRRGPRW